MSALGGALYNAGNVKCLADCSGFDFSECTNEPPPICGNGKREDGETCDGADLGPDATCMTRVPFAFGGQLKCSPFTCNYDFSDCQVPVCGDGSIEGHETCDGSNFGTVRTCSDLVPHTHGTFKCTSACDWDASGCVSDSCGNGKIESESGEACDGEDLGGFTCDRLGYGSGQLACRSNCAYDLSGCSDL